MECFAEVTKNLKAHGFAVSAFATAAEAGEYLNGAIDGRTVGMGGSVTIQELGLYDKLAAHNTVYWHWVNGVGDRKPAATAQMYITSANGVAETGEIVNIDGAGNRIGSMLYGHEKVWIVVGKNKLAPTFNEAAWRARNIAAPKNAQRLKLKTPCAIKGDRCYNCKSPDRICRGLAVLMEPSFGMEVEVVLVNEDLGY